MLQIERDLINVVHFLFEKHSKLRNRVLGCFVSVLDGTVSDPIGVSYAIQNKFSHANHTFCFIAKLELTTQSKKIQWAYEMSLF